MYKFRDEIPSGFTFGLGKQPFILDKKKKVVGEDRSYFFMEKRFLRPTVGLILFIGHAQVKLFNFSLKLPAFKILCKAQSHRFIVSTLLHYNKLPITY